MCAVSNGWGENEWVKREDEREERRREEEERTIYTPKKYGLLSASIDQ